MEPPPYNGYRKDLLDIDPSDQEYAVRQPLALASNGSFYVPSTSPSFIQAPASASAYLDVDSETRSDFGDNSSAFVDRLPEPTGRAESQRPWPFRPKLCKCKCKQFKCESFSMVGRRAIYDEFRSLSFELQKATLLGLVHRIEPSARKPGSLGTRKLSHKQGQVEIPVAPRWVYRHHLKAKDGTPLRVCQKFFLRTLGYNDASSIVSRTFAALKAPSAMAPRVDRRGKHANHGQYPETLASAIEAFVESMHPYSSHHAPKNAPFCRYLQPTLSIMELWRMFGGKTRCGREYFRKVFNGMNISFCIPAQDNCTECLEHEQHLNEHREEEPENASLQNLPWEDLKRRRLDRCAQ